MRIRVAPSNLFSINPCVVRYALFPIPSLIELENPNGQEELQMDALRRATSPATDGRTDRQRGCPPARH